MIRSASLTAIAALCAAHAAAETIPGPPIGVSAGDRIGAFCALRGSATGSAVAFAAGVAIVAIAARRSGKGADA